MKKVLSIMCALALLTGASGCSFKNSSNHEPKAKEETTLNPELSKTVEYKGYTFNVSPYWNKVENDDVIKYYINSDDFFQISEANFTDSFKNTNEYYETVKENNGHSNESTFTADLLENSNGVTFCKILTTFDDKNYGFLLSYNFGISENQGIAFLFSDIGNSESYIHDIIESVKKA